MSSFPMEVGRVVFSKAGRDAGHYFVKKFLQKRGFLTLKCEIN